MPMNFFRRLFSSSKDPPAFEPKDLSHHVIGFKFLFKEEPIEPRIKIDYDALKRIFRRVLQVSDKWHLAYCTHKHGYSLRSFRHFTKAYIPPFIIIIQDCQKNVFGALIEDKLEINENVFGNFNTFLFKRVIINKKEIFKRFDAKDKFICHSTSQFIAFGCSDGYYGLLLNSDMTSGESHPVKTYNNECLSQKRKFNINAMQVWSISL